MFGLILLGIWLVCSGFTLQWTGGQDEGYIVYERVGGQGHPFQEIVRTPGNVTTLNLSPAGNGRYCYFVRAFKATMFADSNIKCVSIDDDNQTEKGELDL